jgi:hypothetical protein
MLRSFVLAIGGSAPAGAGVVVESAGDDERNQICALPCRHSRRNRRPSDRTDRCARFGGIGGRTGSAGGFQILDHRRSKRNARVDDKVSSVAYDEQNRFGRSPAANNHGSFYDTQAAVIALFIGKTDLARKIILDARAVRIARQIEPDGRQPLELARTKSFGYSVFNLRALIDLASIGQNLGVDLWHYQTPDGRSLLKGLEFMSPYAAAGKKWPFQQIYEPNRDDLGELLLRAGPEFPESNLAASRGRLLFKTAGIDIGSTNAPGKPPTPPTEGIQE